MCWLGFLYVLSVCTMNVNMTLSFVCLFVCLFAVNNACPVILLVDVKSCNKCVIKICVLVLSVPTLSNFWSLIKCHSCEIYSRTTTGSNNQSKIRFIVICTSNYTYISYSCEINSVSDLMPQTFSDCIFQ